MVEAEQEIRDQEQDGQLRQLEIALRKQWRLGQNMVLCAALDPSGLLTIVVPHYFLGHFTTASSDAARDSNETFIRSVISGSRLKTHQEIFAVSRRLGVSTSFIKLDQPLSETPQALAAADAVIRRYGIGFVERRAVLLFDIAEFSLYSPFEQASQLNSLSYSMNSAHSKLQRQGVDVNFARTTTGDGYYVWNRDVGPFPDFDLLLFLLLVLLDNAVAKTEASGNTVPTIRAAYHIGSHYELFQAEGIDPTVFSYIVGDVTIRLARLLADAKAGQCLLGNFSAELPGQDGLHGPSAFVTAALAELADLRNLQVGGQPLGKIRPIAGSSGSETPQILDVVAKHGLELAAENLQLDVDWGQRSLTIGIAPP